MNKSLFVLLLIILVFFGLEIPCFSKKHIANSFEPSSLQLTELSIRFNQESNSENVKLSNLERIEFQVLLSFLNVSTSYVKPIDPLNFVDISHSEKKKNLFIEIYDKDENQKLEIPYEISSSGSGFSSGIYTESLNLMIPISKEEKLIKAKNYVESLIKITLNDKTKSEDEKKQLILKKEQLVYTLADVINENRVGRYLMKAKYKSEREGYANFVVESEPVVFEIVSKGSFFDKPEWKIEDAKISASSNDVVEEYYNKYSSEFTPIPTQKIIEILNNHDLEAIDELKKKYKRANHEIYKTLYSAILLRLGVENDEYFYYLKNQVEKVLNDNRPNIYIKDESGKIIDDKKSEEFKNWYQKNNKELNQCLFESVYTFAAPLVDIGLSKDKRFFKYLEKGINSENSLIVSSSASGLAIYGDKKGINLIKNALNNKKNKHIQESIAITLLYFNEPSAEKLAEKYITDKIKFEKQKEAARQNGYRYLLILFVRG